MGSPRRVSQLQSLPQRGRIECVPHVFVSYVREDAEIVDRLADELRAAGVEVWLDRTHIRPGERWRMAIRRAITGGAFFVACFSPRYASRSRTYMNEELTLAIDELRLRPQDRTWFIPIRLESAGLPNRSIGGGESLTDVQAIDLTSNWATGVAQLLDIFCREGSGSRSQDSGEMIQARRHLVDAHRAFQALAVPAELPNAAAVKVNSEYRVEIVYVEPPGVDEDDQFNMHPGMLLGKRLQALGYDASLGYWADAYLLSKLPPEVEDSVYVIHRENRDLASRIVAVLHDLKFAPRILVMHTQQAAEVSEEIPESDFLQYSDLLVALRMAAA